jgi:hypothetical protein
MTCRPGHPARHDDFQPGNVVALKHGAYSERSIAERAELVRPLLYEVCPWLHPTQDVIAVNRFLRAESRALILHDYITGLVDGKGAQAVPQRVWEQATAADNLAAKLGSALGLDPTGRAKLQLTVASTDAVLDDVQANGRRARMADPGVVDAEAEDSDDLD